MGQIFSEQFKPQVVAPQVGRIKHLQVRKMQRKAKERCQSFVLVLKFSVAFELLQIRAFLGDRHASVGNQSNVVIANRWWEMGQGHALHFTVQQQIQEMAIHHCCLFFLSESKSTALFDQLHSQTISCKILQISVLIFDINFTLTDAVKWVFP